MIFEEIDDAVKSIRHGWCTYEKARVLASAIVATRPNVVVEIGVWAGRSLIPMAMALRYNTTGRALAIDPWNAQISSEGMTGENLKWWSSVDHEDIYNHFTFFVNHYGLSNIVEIKRCKSNDVEPPESIGLFHCDGNHSEQAVTDVNRFASKVVIGGFCFCDDIHWTGGGVSMAVEALTNLGFKELFKLDTGAMFQRVSTP